MARGIGVSELMRACKLELGNKTMCEKGTRDSRDYLDVLQGFNDCTRPIVVEQPIFLTLVEQFQAFWEYNIWLKEYAKDYVISEAELQDQWVKLLLLPPDALLFYCHYGDRVKGDVVKTTELAWRYFCYCEKNQISKDERIVFKADYIGLADGEPERASGFYTMLLPPEDKLAIGMKFREINVATARNYLDGDWGMAYEGLQFLGISHRHYLRLMRRGQVPITSIHLAGLFVDPKAEGCREFSPCLHLFDSGSLELKYQNNKSPVFDNGGVGSLRQC